MSTKIYNGYVIKDMNFTRIYNKLIKNYNELDNIRKEELLKLFVRLMYNTYDKFTIFDKFPDKYEQYKNYSLYSLTKKILEDKLKDFLYNHNLQCKIFFYPIQKNKTLLYIQAEQKYIDKLKEFLPLKYYGYWNNTDPDENCSLKEWIQREKDWDKVLPGIGYLHHYGLKFELLPEQIGLWLMFPKNDTLELMEKFKPTLKEREQNVKETLADIKYNELKLDGFNRKKWKEIYDNLGPVNLHEISVNKIIDFQFKD